MLFLNPNITQSDEYKPFISYIREQLNRWDIIPAGKELQYFGSCIAFQNGLKDTNFAIDTIGEYCQCNLIDSSATVKNPTGTRPKECETCEYTRQAECFPCGSEFMETCEFNYAWCQVLEEFAQLKVSIDALYKESENKEPVFCIKNYRL